MRIIVFWDSISEWFWDYEKGGWIQRLKTDFWEKYGYENAVIGFWISAHTSQHLKKYLETCFEAVSKRQENKYKESIVIISIGINDSAISITDGKNQVDFEIFKNNTREISKYLKSETLVKKVIFLENINVIESVINHPQTAKEYFFYNSEITKYNHFLKQHCSVEWFEYIELFGDITESDLQIDGLHPNGDWHERIFQKVKEYLETKILSPHL